MSKVIANREPLDIPTYRLGMPEKNPLFFEKRVYQGSCGKVYPLPFIDKVYDEAQQLEYDSVRLENDFVRLVMLPEIGGRIFLGQDKVNADYDFFYRQDVIKPALVGLAGPWISGGVEFNWPQHHRPGTYMPADLQIEKKPDGSRIVWMSEHDPLNRLKGMHGVCLRPDSALVELKARLYNRTPLTQSFLWWANVAAEVHDNYQSFFPPDVHYVADHAVRAMSSFPIARNDYYGVDYASRQGANDLSRYKHIPVPTSYMVCDTSFSFFGGYDFDAGGGFIHVANPHIAPGKKQWTWGNHEFGWAWDRELTDRIGATGRPAPYVELMAGVYTDNQPDFSYLLPYETKTFSQYWWPYKKIGPVQNATRDVAVRMVLNEDRSLDLGAVASRKLDGARILLRQGERVLLDERVDLSPERPWQNSMLKLAGDDFYALELAVEGMIAYRPVDPSTLIRQRELASEPALPAAIKTQEELYLTAEHLEQYRHPTRYPELYWEEALRRDPADLRTHIACGRRKLNQGLFEEAAAHFATAVKRLTLRHPNPETGEAHYFFGLTRRYQGDFDAAYCLLYKASWNYAWRAAAYYELACLDIRRAHFETALDHLELSLETNATNNKALVAKAICLRKSGRDQAALEVLKHLLAVDPLDHWAQLEQALCQGRAAALPPSSRNDAQTALDVAFDYSDCGCFTEAAAVLDQHHRNEVRPVQVPNPLERTAMTHYALAWALTCCGEAAQADKVIATARKLSADYFFPSRLHEQLVLEWVLALGEPDRNAAYALGNYLFDKKRHQAAIDRWEAAKQADADFATVHRNLGIAYWNVHRDGDLARASYQAALDCDPDDARLVAEFVQLCGKLGDSAQDRLKFLESKRGLALQRDDATVELATLYNETAQAQKALDLLLSRSFHPWEGGEGKVLRQYTSAHLLLGQAALKSGQAESAWEHFQLAHNTPDQLGEKYHLLQAKADVSYWQGMALRALGREAEAIKQFEAAAMESGDFQSMAVTEFSELTGYKALALRELGRCTEAEAVFTAMADYASREIKVPATIDYFATSLPNLLVFEEDLADAKQADMQKLLNFVAQHKNVS